MAEQEGVIKYALHFSEKALDPFIDISPLNFWRQKLLQLNLIGQDPTRYDGYGFGNISMRLSEHSFVISGTQTGHLKQLDLQHYAVVTQFNKQENSLTAYGLWKPSSEALSHGAIYQANSAIKAVFHVHSPTIWNQHAALNCRTTAADIPYGTPQMADALQQQVVAEHDTIVMLGHEDGVISFGGSCEQAGENLVALLD